jgi:hypothetical protein
MRGRLPPPIGATDGRMQAGQFVVYTRDGCGLCDEFIAELAALAVAFEARDVDEDPLTKRRFGLKVPVLTCDGSIVCHGRLEREAVLRLARS